MEFYLEVLRYILEFMSYTAISFICAWYFFEIKRKALPGKLLGAWIVAFIGSIIVTLISGSWFIPFVNWLMSPRVGENFIIRVNLITASIGAFLFLWLYNYVNHDRERKE